MNRYVLIFFMIVGVGDLLYGIVCEDRISILVGSIIVILTIYIARRRRPGDDTTDHSP